MFAHLLDPEEQAADAQDKEPPELADEPAQSDHNARGQRQGHAQTGEQVGEDRHHPLEQCADDQEGQGDHRHRVDQGRLHRRAQLDGLFDVDRQALQDDVENTAGFTGFDHVGGQIIEDLGVLAHGVGQGGATFDRGAHARQRLLERWVLLVGGQNLQTLHQRQAGVDHDRELAEEDGNVLDLDLAGAEGRHDKFLALFADGAGSDALAAQLRGQGLFVGGNALAADLFAGLVLSRKCENWHG